MKKLLVLLCSLLLLVSLAACGEKAAEPEGGALEDMELSEIMTSILDGVPDLPESDPSELTEENFEFFTFVPYEEGFQGMQADALIGSQPHSVVLVRVPADRGADVAETMKANADPRKWICVEAEKTVVRQYGGTILLVMSSGETANGILKNFDALNGVTTPESDLEIPEPAEVELPPELPAADEPVDMPTLAPEEGEDGNMSAVKPDDSAVEMPNAGQSQTPNPVPVKPAPTTPQTPATPEPKPEPIPEPAPEPTEPPAESKTDLSAVMTKILTDVELPSVGEVELTADNFEFYAFLPYADGYRGLASEALINAVAHSVVLVEVPAGEDASQAAQTIQANANPAKWICVEAESVQTAVSGQLVLLVMSNQDTADAIIGNFKAL